MNTILPVPLRPYAKAILPVLGGLIAVGVQYAITGKFDRAELVTALTALGVAAYTSVIANAPDTWARAAKAILPAVGTVCVVGLSWVKTGTFDKTELVIAVTGLVGSLLVYATPNDGEVLI